MSQTRFFKSVITPTIVNPTSRFQDGVASGMWSLQDQARARRGNTWPEAGVANPDEFVENVFSTFLYTGNGSSQTITNGIDLSGDGGLVWTKTRTEKTTSGFNHTLFDTERGITNRISSNNTAAQVSGMTFSANSDGFTDGYNTVNTEDNVSWTFKKTPKFFDVVTYTGNGTAGRTVSHNLGAVPGMIILKNLSSGSEGWRVYHRGANGGTNPEQYYAMLQSTNAFAAASTPWNNTAPTSTEFTLGTDTGSNGNGNSFVAYLFGHDTSSDGMIQCGYYTGDGGAGTTTVDLGFEPQWILVKASSAADNWYMIDNMRGWATHDNTANDAYVLSNATNSEATAGVLDITSTGFKTTLYSNANVNGRTYIYMAIRRGPMATPTAASSVFSVGVQGASPISSQSVHTTGFPVDLSIIQARGAGYPTVFDRLRGNRKYLYLGDNGPNTEADSGSSYEFEFDSDTTLGFNNWWGSTLLTSLAWGRAPGYFDMVAYTGTGSARTVAHNLGVVPEMMWVKRRSGSNNWMVYAGDATDYLRLNTDDATGDGDFAWNDTAPTSSVFTVASHNLVNGSGETYIAYLFATVAGVSKVGSVSHSGSSTDVDCGFTSGSSFILLKRTDASGDWFFWDSARGIVSGNDSYSRFNHNDAEVTNTDLIDPLSSGFTITDDFTDGTYLFYAIAAI